MKSFGLISSAVIIVCVVVYGRGNERREWVPQTHGNTDGNSGSCGGNVSWTLTNEGTLFIYGTGPMADYESFVRPVPWYNLRESILSAIIEEGVTSVGNYTFSNCSSLTSVDISSSVSSIGPFAFFLCTELINVNLPESVTFIGQHAFHNCYNLTRIAIPEGVSSIETSAFSRCFRLTEVKIASSVESIDSHAFYRCTALKELIIPDNVTSIGPYVFSGCSSLTSMSIPDGVSLIPNHSFDNCDSLIEVNFPDRLTSIESEAFSGCTSLTNVIFPAGLDSVDSDAFGNCSSLQSIFYLGSNPEIVSSINSIVNNSPNLELVCLNSSTDCQQYLGLVDSCFVPSYVNGSVVKRKRINATQWENQSNGCIIHECDDESGRTSNNVCKNGLNEMAQYCEEGRCVLSDNSVNKTGYYVEIELQEGIKLNDLIFSQLVESLSIQFGIKPGDLTTGFETDDKGNVIRVVLRTEDEYTANSIATLAEECRKND